MRRLLTSCMCQRHDLHSLRNRSVLLTSVPLIELRSVASETYSCQWFWNEPTNPPTWGPINYRCLRREKPAWYTPDNHSHWLASKSAPCFLAYFHGISHVSCCGRFKKTTTWDTKYQTDSIRADIDCNTGKSSTHVVEGTNPTCMHTSSLFKDYVVVTPVDERLF